MFFQTILYAGGRGPDLSLGYSGTNINKRGKCRWVTPWHGVRPRRCRPSRLFTFGSMIYAVFPSSPGSGDHIERQRISVFIKIKRSSREHWNYLCCFLWFCVSRRSLVPKNVWIENENVFVVKVFVRSISHVDFLVSNNTWTHATDVLGHLQDSFPPLNNLVSSYLHRLHYLRGLSQICVKQASRFRSHLGREDTGRQTPWRR